MKSKRKKKVEEVYKERDKLLRNNKKKLEKVDKEVDCLIKKIYGIR